MSRYMPQFGDSRAPAVSAPVRSTASIVAIISAIASYYMSFHGRGIFAFFLALLAILAGLVGGLRALSPRISGGILSLLAVILGAIAIVFALVAMLL